MGTRERRQREVCERENLFLDTALDLIRQDGLLSLQMSRIAQVAEYAVGTLYLHFASKEDLLLALVNRVFLGYVELIERAVSWEAQTRDRIFAIAVAEAVFVQRHPDYFRIAQYSLCEVAWNAASDKRRQEFFSINSKLEPMVARIVDDARQCGDLPAEGPSPGELGVGVWAVCSGFHNFSHALGMLDSFSVGDPYQVMCRSVQSMLDGFGWKPIAGEFDPAKTDALIQRVRQEIFGDVCNAN